MSSEDISMMATEPFVREFVFAIIQSIRSHNLSYEERHVIDADLIPRISSRSKTSRGDRLQVAGDRSMVASIAAPPKRGNVVGRESLVVGKPKVVGDGMMKSITESVVAPKIVEAPNVKLGVGTMQTRVVASPMVVPHVIVPKVVEPVIQGEVVAAEDYGKIGPLLNDPSVSSIECQGAGKNLTVIRAGRRQMTGIILAKEEIDGILNHVSEVVHIPILEGVFRAAADGFSISAVVSEVVGTRFVVRKAAPYALFEVGHR